ncbi:nucleotidyltransferase [Thermodesulfobacteriota bacterium]
MRPSHFSKDTKDFLRLLEKHRVKYLIVGGEAVIYYGYARLTGDVDFFFESSEENARKLYETLQEFWEGVVPGLDGWEELVKSGTIIQFGVPPNRIDILTYIDGVSFEEAWLKKVTTSIEISGQAVSVHFIGLEELIKNKEKINRPKDQEDLKYLLKAREATGP